MSRPVGFHHSQETKKKISLSHLGTHYGRGIAKTPEAEQIRRAKISRALTGRYPTEETRLKLSERHKGIKPNKRQLQSLKLGTIACQSIEANKKRKLTMSKNWQNPDFVEAFWKANSIKPNRAELKLEVILNKAFPKQFKYNGNFNLRITLGGLIPDFVNVNSRKQVIELFGDYWHSEKRIRSWKRTELGRIMAYASLGWQCLIIWEQELKYEELIIAKIQQFMKGDRTYFKKKKVEKENEK